MRDTGLPYRNRINDGPTHWEHKANRQRLSAGGGRFFTFTEAEEREPSCRQAWLDALDLAVYVPPPQPWWRRLLFGSPAQRFVEQSERSVLLLPHARWPLRHILLILRANAEDWKTLPWLERLAQPGQTAVTLLPVVPPWPRMHQHCAAAQPAPEILLAPNTTSGALIRKISAHLFQQGISTTLSLTSGDPDTRIRDAVAALDPDLLLIAAETHPRILRILYGELVNPLLHWIERPLLIVK